MTAAPKTPKEKIRDNKVKFAHSMVKSVIKNKSNTINIETFDPQRIKDKQYIQEYIVSLEEELHRCLKLQEEECEEDIRQMTVCYQNEMSKIPRTIKNMTVADYNKTNKKDLLHDISSVMNISSLDAFDDKAHAYQTPSRNITNDSTKMIIKTIQRNQRVYTINGSPIQLCDEGGINATCRKKSNSSTEINFEMNIGNGETIAIDSADDLELLDDKYKALAIEKFRKYQEKVNLILGNMAKGV